MFTTQTQRLIIVENDHLIRLGLFTVIVFLCVNLCAFTHVLAVWILLVYVCTILFEHLDLTSQGWIEYTVQYIHSFRNDSMKGAPANMCRTRRVYCMW